MGSGQDECLSLLESKRDLAVLCAGRNTQTRGVVGGSERKSEVTVVVVSERTNELRTNAPNGHVDSGAHTRGPYGQNQYF